MITAAQPFIPADKLGDQSLSENTREPGYEAIFKISVLRSVHWIPLEIRKQCRVSNCILTSCHHTELPHEDVLAGSPSRGGDVAVYVFDMNQPSLPTPFYSVLMSTYVFMALPTVFHFILQTILRFLTLFFRSYFCLIGPFNYLSLYENLIQP